MNSVNLLGRACAQPSIKHVGQNNTPCAEFTLAVDDSHAKKDASGNRPAFFFSITIWGAKAEIIHQHLVKGQQLTITGYLTQQEFTPKGQDKPVQKTRIVAESFQFLAKPKDHQSRDSSWRPAGTNTPEEAAAMDQQPPDDIPF